MIPKPDDGRLCLRIRPILGVIEWQKGGLTPQMRDAASLKQRPRVEGLRFKRAIALSNQMRFLDEGWFWQHRQNFDTAGCDSDGVLELG